MLQIHGYLSYIRLRSRKFDQQTIIHSLIGTVVYDKAEIIQQQEISKRLTNVVGLGR